MCLRENFQQHVFALFLQPGQYGIYSPVSSVLMDVANPNYNLRHVPVTYSPSPISQAIQPPIEISEEGLKQVG